MISNSTGSSIQLCSFRNQIHEIYVGRHLHWTPKAEGVPNQDVGSALRQTPRVLYDDLAACRAPTNS